MPNDDIGTPHTTVGDPPPDDQRIERAWVLIAITKTGGEGIYAQTIGGKYMWNFVATEAGTKDRLEDYLRENGTIELNRRKGITLEWRKFTPTRWDADRVVIT